MMSTTPVAGGRLGVRRQALSFTEEQLVRLSVIRTSLSPFTQLRLRLPSRASGLLDP